MAQHGTRRTTPARRTEPETAAIPDKLYFRIGEVAKLCAIPAYVLRFWESEFPQLRPNKGGSGQRLYRRRDVEMALHIRTLLYEEGFTIAGARQTLKVERREREPQLSLAIVASEAGPRSDRGALERLQREMRELVHLLSVSPAKGSVHTMRAATRATPAEEAPRSNDLFPREHAGDGKP